jgi:hypothetical protein
MAAVAEKLAEETGDQRIADYWKFALEGKGQVYLQRLLDASSPTKGYNVQDILDGRYGEPGAALMMFRTYPRIPFWEQMHDNEPFWTDTGRMNSYCDIPEAIEYGENFIVHREGPEATPYLPNVIVSSNELIRPEDYGIARDELDAEKRTVRNVRLPWREVKNTKNPLWEQGSVLPSHAEDAAMLRLGHGLECDLGEQLRRSATHRQAAAWRRRPAVAHEPAGGARPGARGRRLRLRRCQPGRPALRGL